MRRMNSDIGSPKDEPIWHDRDDFIWHDEVLPVACYPEQDKEQTMINCRCGSTKYLDSHGICAYCYLKWRRYLEACNDKGVPLFERDA